MDADIVDRVKQATKIEEIVTQDGFKLPDRGRYRKAAHSNGLVVDTRNQTYHWNGTGEYGDVIAWVMIRKKVDFKEAVTELARKAGLPEPQWSRADQAVRLAARVRADALTVAARVFAGWFWGSALAQEYAQKRGWTLARESDEGTDRDGGTVSRAMLGFSGRGTDQERIEMRDALISAGVDINSPVAVSILGYKGNVASWAVSHGLTDLNEDWVLNGYIPGMVGRERLVYPHLESGRVVYLSARSIVDKFHYNLPEVLVGKRQVYFNHEYAPGEQHVVVVEGQADALSLAQWDIPAVALAGVKLDDELVGVLQSRHKAIYVALDADVAGINNAWKVAEALGPMCRVMCARDPLGVVFPTSESMTDMQRAHIERANGLVQALGRVFSFPIPEQWAKFDVKHEEVKDMNDLLQAMTSVDVNPDQQRYSVSEMLKKSPTFAEMAAAWAGSKQGAERDQAVRDALSVITRMGELDMSQYRTKLAKWLGVGVRELANMIKTFNEKAKEAATEGEPVLTWGEYVNGWLIDYIYEPDTGHARLCWRDPGGKIETGQYIVIDGKKYEPYPPTEGIKKGVVLMPSKLGEKKSLRELATYIEMYLNSAFILPSESTGKLIANYVLLTWLYDAFDAVSYLAFMGDTGSGKSQFMFRVGLICYRAIIASGASSVSSLFRMVDRYKGSVVIDEADLEKSDTTQDMVKFYNTGAMRGGAITKSVDVVLPDGRHDYEERSFQTYCPKLMTLKRNFQDDAVTSRSLVIKLQPREMIELVRKNIPLNIDDQIREKTKALRNLLLRFRMETWQPTIKVNPHDFDLTVSARLNQVAGGLLAIAADDPEQQEMIRRSLREYYRESQITKSMTITARVIEAMWSMWKFPDMRQIYVTQEADGRFAMKIGEICKVSNDIIDKMNSEDTEDDGDDKKKFKQKGIKPHSVGRIVREDLQLQVSARRRDGFFVYWDEARMEGVALRYGLELDQIGPIEGPLEKTILEKEDEKRAKKTGDGGLTKGHDTETGKGSSKQEKLV
jgi:hypothetical protein